MLTTRGWWLFLLSCLTIVLSALLLGRYSSVPPLLGISLLGWFAWEYVQFQRVWLNGVKELKLSRVVQQQGRTVPVLWAGSEVIVTVTIHNESSFEIPLLLVQDRPPSDAVVDHSRSQEITLPAFSKYSWSYQVKVNNPGTIRFEGSTVRFADLNGLFYQRRFISLARDYLVLPFAKELKQYHRDIKRFNALPPPGVHRLRRAGSGDDLHDLRDYRPGDSPKTIAWKASARRDRLITKEFESDVPIRCTIFVDARTEVANTSSLNLGPIFGRRTTRYQSIEIATGILQASSVQRDLFGCVLFEDERTITIRPARSKLHKLKLLQQLGQTAGQLPRPHGNLEMISRAAYKLANELYPERLQRDVNSRPLGLFWRPITDSYWFYLLIALLCMPVLWSRRFVLEVLAEISGTFAPMGYTWALFLVLILLPTILAGLLWFFHGIRGFLPPQNRRRARRKQLALLFASQDNADPAMVEAYLNDDDRFLDRAGTFLQYHRVRWDTLGERKSTASGFINTVALSLCRAVSHAKDTELYVLILELLDEAEQPSQLYEAIRMATARKHRVILLLAMPVELSEKPSLKLIDLQPGDIQLRSLARLAQLTAIERKLDAMCVELTRAGATILRYDANTSARLVQQRLEQLRQAGIRR